MEIPMQNKVKLPVYVTMESGFEEGCWDGLIAGLILGA